MPSLDRTLAALADPTRRELVARLTRGPVRVTDLAAPFAMSLNAVSKHIKVLESAGLVRRRRVGREHRLELDAAPLRGVADWLASYERFWTEQLDNLDRFLRTRTKEN
jgi:DNA-binding transcriptional ArsR family regulator